MVAQLSLQPSAQWALLPVQRYEIQLFAKKL
jgi:hypothetical protein